MWKKAERILWVLAVVGFLVGLFGLYKRIAVGHTAAAYNSYVPWGLWVGLYAVLIGVSVGAYFISSLVFGFRIEKLRPVGKIALYAALASLVGGLTAIWLDLGHPARFYKLFTSTSFSSVMGVLAWVYLVYGLLLLALIYLAHQDSGGGLIHTLSLLGLPLIVLLGGAEGSLFGVVGAQELWESGLTPILFLVEGALSGVALIMFLGVIFGELHAEARQLMRRLTLSAMLVLIVLELAEYSTAFYAGIPAKVDGIQTIMFGRFWWVFWILHIGLGLLIPLIFMVFAPENQTGLTISSGLIVATSLATKLNLIIPSLVVPEFEELRDAFTGPGLNFHYFPTPTEWLLSLWIVSLAALIFLGAYRFLPVSVSEQKV